MKISSLIIPASCILVLFAACEQESRPKKRDPAAGSNRFGDTRTPGTPTDFVDDSNAAPTPSPVPTPDDPTAATPTPTPGTTTPTVRNDIPYGTPVAGKPGFVTSPHAPYAGYVDVRGFGPGMEVKDPFSGKIFLVP